MISFAKCNNLSIANYQENCERIVFWVTKEWLLFTIEWRPALHYGPIRGQWQPIRRLNYSEPIPPVEGSSQKTIVHNCSLFCQTLAGVAALIPFQFFPPWQHPAGEETKS